MIVLFLWPLYISFSWACHFLFLEKKKVTKENSRLPQSLRVRSLPPKADNNQSLQITLACRHLLPFCVLLQNTKGPYEKILLALVFRLTVFIVDSVPKPGRNNAQELSLSF